MNCPLCKAESTVIDSRPTPEVDGSIRRRRQCDSCKHRWTTYEISATSYKRVQRVERIVAELAVEE